MAAASLNSYFYMNKQQKPDKIIDGRMMRYSAKFNVWVNSDGDYVYREYNNKDYNRPLIIHKRPDGSKYLNTTHPGIIELDELVADCYVPKPQDAKKYTLVHKDNNKCNCKAANLEWGLDMAAYKAYLLSKKRKTSNGLTVSYTGEVYDGKDELAIIDHVYDGDTERFVAIDPYYRYYRKNSYGREEPLKAYPDDLMAEAEFVEGNKSDFTNPKVLHINGDYLDFNDDNLVWTDMNSPEYQKYMAKKRNDIAALTDKLNEHNH